MSFLLRFMQLHPTSKWRRHLAGCPEGVLVLREAGEDADRTAGGTARYFS